MGHKLKIKIVKIIKISGIASWFFLKKGLQVIYIGYISISHFKDFEIEN